MTTIDESAGDRGEEFVTAYHEARYAVIALHFGLGYGVVKDYESLENTARFLKLSPGRR